MAGRLIDQLDIHIGLADKVDLDIAQATGDLAGIVQRHVKSSQHDENGFNGDE